MSLVSGKFPGLSWTSELYDDEYVQALVDEGTDLFRGLAEKALPSYSEETFFPLGSPPRGEKNLKEISAEVGDDLIEVSNLWNVLVGHVAVLRDFMDLRISDKDTSINDGIGNYAEGLVSIPRTYGETWLSQKSLHREETMRYFDIPKIRLILPVRNQRQVWSSTEVGKFTDLGSALSWTPRRSPLRGMIEIASLMQDALLGATSRRKCVYLPTGFGGAGKTFPFHNVENVEVFFKTYRNGTYRDLLTTVIRQTNNFVLKTTQGRQPKVPLVLEHFTKWDPVFTNWVKDEQQLIHVSDVNIPRELQVHKAGTLKYGDESYWYLPRLLAEGCLVSETKLRIALQHNLISEALVSSETIPEFREKLDKVHADWKSDPLCGEILNNEEFKEEIRVSLLAGPILGQEVHRFMNNTRYTRDLRRLIQSEDVYHPESLDGIYRQGPMVLKKGLYARPNNSQFTVDVNAWQYQVDRENPEYKKYLEELLEWFKNPMGKPVPRDFVEDDDLLLREIGKTPKNRGVVIVTDDWRLCKDIAFKLHRHVLRVPVEWYYRLTYFGDGMENTISWIKSNVRGPQMWSYYEDTGSIQSGEEKYFRDGMMYPSGFPQERLDYSSPWGSKPTTVGTPVELDFGAIETAPAGFPQRYQINGRNPPKWRKRPHETREGRW